MALTPPPIPPTHEELLERFRNGARTFEELDPEFHKWMAENQKSRIFGYACMVIGLVVLATIIVIYLLLNHHR